MRETERTLYVNDLWYDAGRLLA